MADLKLQNVRKNFGNIEVIPGFDLEINSGEFLVLVGPSGSGKSTLLRMIAGLEETTSGDIIVDGQNITHVDPSARDFAMVFQSYALYPHMTVEQNISFALRMRKENPDEIDRRVKEAIAMLNLTGLEKRKPGQLSGGQRQRVAMGRCVARKPKLFLFDEPLSNLDAKLRVQTRIEIRRLHERIKATSIFVTHDQVEAMTMADRIALLKDGRLQQVGTPQELYLKPSNSFVATFMGTPEMNLFEGEIALQGDRLHLEGKQAMSLPAGADFRAALQATTASRKKVRIGVRPEHLDVLRQQAPGSMQLDVNVVEWLGHEIFVFGDFNGRQVIVRVPDTDRSGQPAMLPKAGDRLFLAPMLDRWHVFDADDGRNLLVCPAATSCSEVRN